MARIGNVQGCLDAGDATANNQGSLGKPELLGKERFMTGSLSHRHSDQLDGLLGGCLLLITVHPTAMLSQVSYLQEVRIESG